MKKLVLLLAVLGLGAGGGYVYRGFQEGRGISDEHVAPVMSGEEVREGLRSPDLMTRLAAVEQMAKLAGPDRKQALLEALADSLAVVRLTAVTALSDGFPRDPAVVDRLLVAARGDLDADVREEAHRALAASGDPRVLALAVETLDSADATLDEKLAAAETLDRVTGQTTATDLADRLDGAEEAADELGVAWGEWLAGRKDCLSWDEEAGRFVEER